MRQYISKRFRDITKEEFYRFCQEYEPKVSHVDGETLVENIGNDGDAAIYFFEQIDKEFFVNFKNFDFTKYFHNENEIIRAMYGLGIFNRLRKIEHKLTVDELYDYIINNRTDDYKPWDWD